MRTTMSELNLRRATSLDQALGILRDENRTPIAGATDVYVALNYGTTGVRQFLDIWALDELRTIVKRDDTLEEVKVALAGNLCRYPMHRLVRNNECH